MRVRGRPASEPHPGMNSELVEMEMKTTQWSGEMSLGVPQMDAAHERFVEDLGLLLTIRDEKFAAEFVALVARVEADFREEEQLMEDLDYPGTRAHREQHARVLGALHHVVPRVLDGDIALGREAVELLPQWFLMHLSTMDAALACTLELAQAENQ